MPGWLQQLIVPLASAAGGGLLTALAVMWRYGHALIEGMRAIMRGELHRIHRETVEKGLPVSMDVAQETDDIYKAYHDGLHGNGLGTKLWREIMDSHNGPPPENKEEP